MPVFGFNTDIRVGEMVFHVQTEDRGTSNPVLDTTVYWKGRVLAKRGTSYKDFLTSPDFNESELHSMLERQHKQMIEDIRSGRLPEIGQLAMPARRAGVGVQLLNPASFLQGTTATLRIRTTKQPEGSPLPGTQIRVQVHTGTPQPLELTGESGPDGETTLQFPMPRLGPGGADLLIQASSPEGQDEARYSMRPRPRSQA